MRLVIEPVVGRHVIWTQRDFIKGRSMIAILVDIEEAMVVTICSSGEGGAFLFDFAPAFPSVEQNLMLDLFTAKQ